MIIFFEGNQAKAVKTMAIIDSLVITTIFRGAADPDCNIENLPKIEIADVELTEAIKNCELELQENGDVKNLATYDIYSQIYP